MPFSCNVGFCALILINAYYVCDKEIIYVSRFVYMYVGVIGYVACLIKSAIVVMFRAPLGGRSLWHFFLKKEVPS